ncbi:hypothetical protein K8R42_00495 [bacterium]|nr:hypothetical protein [bacterium]
MVSKTQKRIFNGGKEKYCPHCWPTKRKNHALLHLEHYLNKLVKPFTILFFRQENLWKHILVFLNFLKIVNFEKNPDETQIYNRSLIFFKEAKNRGIDISIAKVLGNYSNDFKFIYKGKEYHYEGIPINIKQPNSKIDDKHYIKRILSAHKMPVPRGQLFTNVRKALRFARALGFPLVVKPNSGSLSHHITCNIGSEEELILAMNLAKKYSPTFILEEFIFGDMYRATVVGQEHVFVCRKDRANIVGDGQLTIEELIKIKNSDDQRGSLHQKDTTLHEIQIDQILENNLDSQGLSLDSILPVKQKVYLQDKYVLSHGCDIISHNDDVHSDNKKLFIQIAKLLKTDLVGIDFISPNIRQSYKNQQTGVLEANTLPYIDMHAFPSHGRPEPVAELVWDFVLEKLK